MMSHGGRHVCVYTWLECDGRCCMFIQTTDTRRMDRYLSVTSQPRRRHASHVQRRFGRRDSSGDPCVTCLGVAPARHRNTPHWAVFDRCLYDGSASWMHECPCLARGAPPPCVTALCPGRDRSTAHRVTSTCRCHASKHASPSRPCGLRGQGRQAYR